MQSEFSYDKIVNTNINSFYGSLINIVEESKNYYILAFINGSKKFVLLKLYFQYDSNRNIQCQKKKETPFDGSENYVVSCYILNGDLICAFLASNSHFTIIILDTSFNSKKQLYLSITSSSSFPLN